MKSAWIGIGFSHHNVPSLSNTATRSSTGTSSDTVRSTNSTTARCAAPSCQLDNTPLTRPAYRTDVTDCTTYRRRARRTPCGREGGCARERGGTAVKGSKETTDPLQPG